VAPWDERDPREVDGFRRWVATFALIVLTAAMCRMNRIRTAVAVPAAPPAAPPAVLPPPVIDPARRAVAAIPVLPLHDPPGRTRTRGAPPLPVLPLEAELAEGLDAGLPHPPTQPHEPA
jgi:hypothetical protein